MHLFLTLIFHYKINLLQANLNWNEVGQYQSAEDIPSLLGFFFCHIGFEFFPVKQKSLKLYILFELLQSKFLFDFIS